MLQGEMSLFLSMLKKKIESWQPDKEETLLSKQVMIRQFVLENRKWNEIQITVDTCLEATFLPGEVGGLVDGEVELLFLLFTTLLSWSVSPLWNQKQINVFCLTLLNGWLLHENELT